MSYRLHIYYCLKETFYTFRQYGCFKWCSCCDKREEPEPAGGTLNEIIFEPAEPRVDVNDLSTPLVSGGVTPQITLI